MYRTKCTTHFTIHRPKTIPWKRRKYILHSLRALQNCLSRYCRNRSIRFVKSFFLETFHSWLLWNLQNLTIKKYIYTIYKSLWYYFESPVWKFTYFYFNAIETITTTNRYRVYTILKLINVLSNSSPAIWIDRVDKFRSTFTSSSSKKLFVRFYLDLLSLQ